MMASKKPFTLVLSGILALSMLSPAALAAEVQDNGSNDVPRIPRSSSANPTETSTKSPTVTRTTAIITVGTKRT